MAESKIPFVDPFFNFHDIASNSDLDDLSVPGVYRCSSGTVASTLSNCPHTTSAFAMIAFRALGATTGAAIQFIIAGEAMYARKFANSAWGSWYKYTGSLQS